MNLNIIKELNPEETIGITEASTITEDLLQAKVHEIVFRLRVQQRAGEMKKRVEDRER
jgi:hypothetical protein